MSMTFSWFQKNWKTTAWTVAAIGIFGAAWLFQKQWLPSVQRFVAYIQNKDLNGADEVKDENEEAASETPDTLTLSPTAWKNIGLVTDTVQPRDFVKIVSVPATVVERPGRSKIDISAPMKEIF